MFSQSSDTVDYYREPVSFPVSHLDYSVPLYIGHYNAVMNNATTQCLEIKLRINIRKYGNMVSLILFFLKFIVFHCSCLVPVFILCFNTTQAPEIPTLRHHTIKFLTWHCVSCRDASSTIPQWYNFIFVPSYNVYFFRNSSACCQRISERRDGRREKTSWSYSAPAMLLCS